MSKLYNVLLKLKNETETISASLADKLDKSTITVKSVSGSSKSITTGTYTSLCSLSLEAGTWVVHGTAQSGGASSGDLHVIINTAAAWDANHMQKIKLSSGGSVVSATAILTLTSAATYYLVAMQNSGSSLTISRSHLEAVRLSVV